MDFNDTAVWFLSLDWVTSMVPYKHRVNKEGEWTARKEEEATHSPPGISWEGGTGQDGEKRKRKKENEKPLESQQIPNGSR